MSNWVKWWKDKTFLLIWGILLLSMGVSLCIILINPDSAVCIIGALAMPSIGGMIIKKIVGKKLDEWSEK